MDNSVFFNWEISVKSWFWMMKLFSIFEDDVYKSKFLPKITFSKGNYAVFIAGWGKIVTLLYLSLFVLNTLESIGTYDDRSKHSLI